MDIIYLRSARRTMALEITKDLRVVVRLPAACPQKRAERFVAEHMDWICTHYEIQRRRSARYQLSQAEQQALREKAKAVLPGRVEHFARLTGLSPTGVGITAAKTRFGSCSAKNKLNFSLYLMLYSSGAIDYVVLHEICHIQYKNHSPAFYQLIGQYMPDYKTYVKELRE